MTSKKLRKREENSFVTKGKMDIHPSSGELRNFPGFFINGINQDVYLFNRTGHLSLVLSKHGGVNMDPPRRHFSDLRWQQLSPCKGDISIKIKVK